MLRLLSLISLLAVLASSAGAADPFGGSPSLKAPSVAVVKTKALVWLSGRSVGADKLAAARRLWEGDVPAEAVLDRLAKTLALGDERVAALVAVCGKAAGDARAPDVGWLDDKSLDPLVCENLRLYYGRWLARNQLYDEAREEFKHLKPEAVIDPASLLFFEGVCCHSLLKKEPGLAAVDRLLDDVEGAPSRYLAVAALMRRDLESLEDDSLDYAARLMNDAKRRLALGRAGKRVRRVEDEVVEVLEKLIDELERRQPPGDGPSTPPRPSNKPAEQPSINGPFGTPGKVDRKNLGIGSNWPDLPPKQRVEALQPLAKDFPAHYRAAIEQYFRRLAAQGR